MHRADFVDWWSAVHVGFWLVVGVVASWRLHQRRPLPVVLGVALLAAYAWEAIELAIAEAPVLWSNQESPVNRWVSDPLMALIGVPLGWWIVAARRRPQEAYAD